MCSDGYGTFVSNEQAHPPKCSQTKLPPLRRKILQELYRRDEVRDACYNGGRVDVPRSLGEVEISEHYSGVWRAWHMTPARNSAMTSLHEIFQVDEGVVRLEPTLYVDCNAESMKLHTACLFEKSKLTPV
jgi:hypothetical protein